MNLVIFPILKRRCKLNDYHEHETKEKNVLGRRTKQKEISRSFVPLISNRSVQLWTN